MDAVTVDKRVIDRVNMLIAHYELGLSECRKIKKELAPVSTRASKKSSGLSAEEKALIAARRKKRLGIDI